MNKNVRIFYNPECSKCLLAMTILKNNDVEITVVDYLNTPPGSTELNEVLKLLNMQPRELMRKHETPYKNNKLDNPNLSHEQLIQAMIDNPILIERPIVINDNKAIIGRPPEKVLDIL